MATIKCHFDGKVFVPDQPVSLPLNEPGEVYVGKLLSLFSSTDLASCGPNVETDSQHSDFHLLAADELREHQRRPFGLAAGEFVVPDDFDEPLSDDILTLFE